MPYAEKSKIAAYAKRKKDMLGATHGSATNQLRKMIMFDMAGKLGLLSCYRCQKPITRIPEFSIDHKEAWEGAENPAESFFDLGNIAFSHMACNSFAANRKRKYSTMEEAQAAVKASRLKWWREAQVRKSKKSFRDIFSGAGSSA